MVVGTPSPSCHNGVTKAEYNNVNREYPACLYVCAPGAEGGGLGVYAKSDGGAVYFAATNVSASFNSVTGGSGGEVLPVGMMHPLAVLMDWWVVLAQ